MRLMQVLHLRASSKTAWNGRIQVKSRAANFFYSHRAIRASSTKATLLTRAPFAQGAFPGA
jgi:hypothetical protein